MTQAPTDKPGQIELIPGMTEAVPKIKKAHKNANTIDAEHLPPNFAQPVKVKVPDFSDPKRPHDVP